MRISVRVIPRSSKNEISQEGEMFKVRLTAPPVDGAANEALLTLLAERLGISKRSLHIIHGTTSRQKIIQLDALIGLSSADLAKKLCQ
ncbi:MAG TPA: DUF167 domain-containing protein [Ktedonobacteraceae bacterium]|jgi:hypothetical protein